VILIDNPDCYRLGSTLLVFHNNATILSFLSRVRAA